MCVAVLETLQESVVDTVSSVAGRLGIRFGYYMLRWAAQGDVCNSLLAGQDYEMMQRSMSLDCFELMQRSAVDKMRFVVADCEERRGTGERAHSDLYSWWPRLGSLAQGCSKCADA